MDPAQYQEILNYSQHNSKLQASLSSSGNVVMLPVVHVSGGGEAQSPTDSLSQHVTTHIITPEQVGRDGCQLALLQAPQWW
jgi:ribosomal protein L2